jgi:hypothetical protein
MGKIIRFPIYVDTTKSSETAYGLLNSLQPIVRDPSIAATDATVSEKALVRSLSGLSFQTSGINLGAGADIFVSAGMVYNNTYGGFTNVLQYRTLSLSGDGFGIEKDNGVIYLTSDQEQLATDIGTVYMNYFNGGIIQEAKFVDVTQFPSSNSMTLLRSPASRTAFGKVMIQKVSDFAFDTNAVSGDIVYSIGTDGNPVGIIENISTVYNSNSLMDFTYGGYMADNVQYVENGSFTKYADPTVDITGSVTGMMIPFNSNMLAAGTDIKIFRSVPDGVSSHSQGAFNVVMFYDMPDVPTSESHTRSTVYMAGGKVDPSVDDWDALTNSPASVLNTMQRYNIDNSTCNLDFKMTLPTRNCRYALMQNSDLIWYVGGQVTAYNNSILIANPFTSTISMIAGTTNGGISIKPRPEVIGDIPNATAQANGIFTNSYGYVFCGGNGTTASTLVPKVIFATGVFSNSISNSQTGYNCNVFSRWCSNDYAYIYGGRSDATTLNTPGTAYKFSLATDTNAGSTCNIITLYSMNTAGDNSDTFCFGGHATQSQTMNYVIKYSHATDTIAYKAGLPFRNASSACVTNASHTDIYLMGGNDNAISGPGKGKVVRYSITTNTSQIINNICIPATDFRGARS